MQVLRLKAAATALPPSSQNTSIDARQLVCEGTRWFLEHPQKSAVNHVDPSIKLHAKVHIHADEALAFCKLLVERRICTWVPQHEVLVVNGQKVLKGMFGVGKGTFLESGEEIQRAIMNLIPTNACFAHAQGATRSPCYHPIPFSGYGSGRDFAAVSKRHVCSYLFVCFAILLVMSNVFQHLISR